ncbi:MAG: polysaccharide pyruvyl transferase family protein [Thermodesulfobacteriota bacterium]
MRKKVDYLLSGPFHSCIAALSQGVPCVGIAYSHKFEGVFNTVGMEDWVVDGRKVGNEEAITRVLALYKKREQARVQLRESVAVASSKVQKEFWRIKSVAKSKDENISKVTVWRLKTFAVTG